MKRFLIFLFIAITFQSCKKADFSYPDDPNYPTIFKKLSVSKLSELRTAFFQRNLYLTTSLNDFGFCGYDGNIRSAETPPFLNSPTQSEAIAFVKSFATLNPACTGVNNPGNLNFTDLQASTWYGDGSTGWFLKTSNQQIDTIEVLNSQIIFHVRNREITTCLGNWYPDIYIPTHFNINRDKAKSMLLNKTVSHTSFVGLHYTVNITAGDLDKSTVKLVVLPVITVDKIELLVTWEINIPGPVYYLIYVDVMTGEIVGKVPTTIS